MIFPAFFITFPVTRQQSHRQMTLIPKTLIQCLTPLFFACILSSCANDTNFSLNPNLSASDTTETSSTETDNVHLEALESKACLNEELVALRQTGTWDEIASSDNIALPSAEDFDFPVVLNKKVNMYLDLFQNSQRATFSSWLARSAKYQPMIEKELEEAGLPKDLLYLAMIESGYNQLACSSARAVGLWQFMEPTGKQYDLRVDKYVDERRDPLKSTKAAVTYLSDLYQEFDDWYLAVAAYNSGPGTIRNGLKKHNVDNFWDLAGKEYLSIETKRYVPKLIAALLIAKNPEKFGFTNISYDEPLRSDTITVGPGMSLDAIALISNSTAKKIQELNQELRLGKTPLNTDKYEVNIPEDTADIAAKNLSRLHSIVSVDYKTHKVGKGDTLTKISKKYNVNKTTLLKVNDLHGGKIAYGANLRIPYNTVTYKLLPQGSSGANVAYQDSLVLHKIKKGDTISKIADIYSVPPQMIVEWNGLKNAHSIRAGQQLALYIDHTGNNRGKKSVASITSGKTMRLVAPKAHKNLLKQPGTESPYEHYSVQNGDSLWTISRKFSASTSEIKKWNNLTSDRIQPGAILKLKKV